MSDDGSITYASECAQTDSEEDYGGEDEEVVAHQEEPDVCHKVITRESLLAAQVGPLFPSLVAISSLGHLETFFIYNHHA
jgi:hypothetical protein